MKKRNLIFGEFISIAAFILIKYLINDSVSADNIMMHSSCDNGLGI